VRQNRNCSESQPKSSNPAPSKDSTVGVTQANTKFQTFSFDSLRSLGLSHSSIF